MSRELKLLLGILAILIGCGWLFGSMAANAIKVRQDNGLTLTPPSTTASPTPPKMAVNPQLRDLADTAKYELPEGGYITYVSAIDSDVCIISLKGMIDQTSEYYALRIIDILNAKNCTKKQFILSSAGGYVESALSIAYAVRNNGVDTQIAKGGICNSACAMVFVAGNERYAYESDRLGVHQLREEASNKCVSDVNANRHMREHYVGMLGSQAGNIVYDMQMLTSCDKMSYFSSKKMRELGISTAVWTLSSDGSIRSRQ